MSNKMKTISSLAIGLIVIIITLVVYFVGFSSEIRKTIDIAALCFVLISEVAFFAGLIITLNYKEIMSKTYLSSGVISSLFIYLVITVILSLFSRLIFQDNLRGFITTQTIVIGIVLIVIISLIASASKVESVNKKALSDITLMQDSENIAFSLVKDTKLNPYSGGLNRLYEDIKYSDKISFDKTMDREINERLAELSDKLKKGDIDILNEEDINNNINHIISIIKERNELLKQSKRGGY